MTPSRRLLLLLILLLTGSVAQAQTSASHRVFVGIEPITVMAVSGDPMPLNVVLDPGSARTAQDASSYYNLTTNVDKVFIEARMDEPMPDGVRLRLRAESSIGHSLGAVTLTGDGRSRRVVGSMGRGLENGRHLEYELLVDPGTEPMPFQTRLVVLALVNPETGFRQELSQMVQFSVQAPATSSAQAGN